MPQIHNFSEADQALSAYYGNTRTPYTLDAISELMTYLDNPQEKLRVLHIAGTSGKTSTSYYCAALLRQSGFTTGLFVSPHIDAVNERLQIDGQPLPEAEYCMVLSEFLELIETAPVKPSYFELLVALAFWEFARRGIDVAVMEVGLGGLLDATNVVQRQDKVCVITDIGYDHTEILGDTLEEIAAQKAGIIQPGNQVFMNQQSPTVTDVIMTASEEQGAELHINQSPALQIDTLPLFQQRNLSIATTAVQSMIESPITETMLAEAAQTYIPARLEARMYQDKTIIIDGSHNQQKLTALFESLQALYPDQDFAALVAFSEGNDQRWQDGLETLSKYVKHMIFTTFHGAQDMPKTSVDSLKIVKHCETIRFHDYQVEPGAEQAFKLLIKRSEPVLLVTGSFYVLNHIRPLLIEVKS